MRGKAVQLALFYQLFITPTVCPHLCPLDRRLSRFDTGPDLHGVFGTQSLSRLTSRPDDVARVGRGELLQNVGRVKERGCVRKAMTAAGRRLRAGGSRHRMSVDARTLRQHRPHTADLLPLHPCRTYRSPKK